MAYLNRSAFANLTVLPASDLEAIESVAAGWLDVQLEAASRWIDARLSKRYAVPFGTPAPEIVRAWVARIVTLRAMLRRGVDPSDLQFQVIKEDADAALAEIREAADADAGLFDLPLRGDLTVSGIARGGTRGYSEASPYVWMDEQARTGRREDRSGRGSRG